MPIPITEDSIKTLAQRYHLMADRAEAIGDQVAPPIYRQIATVLDALPAYTEDTLKMALSQLVCYSLTLPPAADEVNLIKICCALRHTYIHQNSESIVMSYLGNVQLVTWDDSPARSRVLLIEWNRDEAQKVVDKLRLAIFQTRAAARLREQEGNP